jgi:hypothetical protein
MRTRDEDAVGELGDGYDSDNEKSSVWKISERSPA